MEAISKGRIDVRFNSNLELIDESEVVISEGGSGQSPT